MTAPTFPACADCGKAPEVTPRGDGRLLLWHACHGHSVALGAQDEAHARELWAGYAQERAR